MATPNQDIVKSIGAIARGMEAFLLNGVSAATKHWEYQIAEVTKATKADDTTNAMAESVVSKVMSVYRESIQNATLSVIATAKEVFAEEEEGDAPSDN